MTCSLRRGSESNTRRPRHDDECGGRCAPSLSLGRHERVTKKADFLRAYQQGRRIYLPGLTVILVPNKRACCRLGISAGRKIGGAFQRNQAKRRMRELFRHSKPLFQPGLDVIFVPNRRILASTHLELIEALSRALRTNQPRRGQMGLDSND